MGRVDTEARTEIDTGDTASLGPHAGATATLAIESTAVAE